MLGAAVPGGGGRQCFTAAVTRAERGRMGTWIQEVGLAQCRPVCPFKMEGVRGVGPGSPRGVLCPQACSPSRAASPCSEAAPRFCHLGLKDRSVNGDGGPGVSPEVTFLLQTHCFYLVAGFSGELQGKSTLWDPWDTPGHCVTLGSSRFLVLSCFR